MIPVIVNETYRKFPDGREICLETKKGKAEYKRRREAMAIRQFWLCACGCFRFMLTMPGLMGTVTFQHDALRGKDRDDRIEDEQGNWLNRAMRYECNMRLGSQRKATV